MSVKEEHGSYENCTNGETVSFVLRMLNKKKKPSKMMSLRVIVLPVAFKGSWHELHETSL